MFIETRADLISSLKRLAETPQLNLRSLQQFAEAIQLAPDLLAALKHPDAGNPYGRNVLYACPVLECMIATWTPAFPCRPHDHGGSRGAVRILQGRANHEVWHVDQGMLQSARVHTVAPGEVLACGPSLVHSMGAPKQGERLVTLHLYTRSIDHMIVYDHENRRTHVVEGSCGAWIPTYESGLLRSTHDGILSRAELRAA